MQKQKPKYSKVSPYDLSLHGGLPRAQRKEELAVQMPINASPYDPGAHGGLLQLIRRFSFRF